MDWGVLPLLFCALYFFGYILIDVITDPQTWQPADITKPDIGHKADGGFNWAMMMNQDND